MRKMRALSVLMAAALAVTSVAVTPSSSDAAKKIKLSKKSKTIAVSGSFTLKLKNGKKKAKVTWVVNKKGKSVVKLSKKVKAGNKASVKITGKKKGKATVTAKYKLGKAKVKKFNCKVTVKKAVTVTPTPAASGNAPVATSPAATANGTAAPSSSATVTANPTGDATATPTGGDDKPTVTKTPKPPKTPSPVPTEKPTGEPPKDKDVIDILANTVVGYTDGFGDENSAGIKVTKNADGSQTVSFVGVEGYKGVRWYFGTDADNLKKLNLSGFSYLVVEGENQAGVEQYVPLTAQFLDGADKADHGGLKEIASVDDFILPIKLDLSGNDLSNVAAFEIYIRDGKADNNTASVGPFTIKSIKAYKDEATYKRLTGEPDATAAPTAEPIYGDYTFDFSDPNCYKAEQGGKATYNAADKTLDIEYGDFQGVVFLLPGGAVNKYDRIEMTYTLTGGDVRAYVYDGAFNGGFGQNDPGAHEIYLDEAATDKTVTFTVQDGYVDNCVKGLKLFNWAGKGKGTMKIKSLKYIQAPGGMTPPPTQAPTQVPTTAPTQTPTQVPDRVAETLDLSKADPASAFADDKLTLNDIDQVILPISAALKNGEEVSVKINGELAEGHSDFRAWIGNGNNAGSNIVMFENLEAGKFSKVVDITAKDFGENDNPKEWTKLTIKKKSWDSPKLNGITITSVEVAKKGTLTEDVIPVERKAETLDLSKADPASAFADDKLTLNDIDQVILPISAALENGEEVSVKINGELAEGHSDFRAWIGNGNNAGSNIVMFENLEAGKFSKVVDITAKDFGENDNPKEWTKLTIKKKSWDSPKLNGITITSVEVAKKGTLTEDEISKPVVVDPKNVTIEDAFVVDLSKAASFTDESVQLGEAASATYSYDEATGVATYELGKNLSGFSVAMPAGESYEKVEITYSRTKGENDKWAAFVYDSRFVGYGYGQPGDHEEALLASDDYTTVTYVPKNGYEGNCIKGLKIFNFAGGATGDASTLKIKSIKFFRKADTISAKTYELADAKADSVISIANESKYGTIGFKIGEFDSYVADYDSIYAAVNKLYRKDGGTVKKYLENDGEVSYKATEDGKGTLTIKNNGKEYTADVTVEKSESGKDITATFVSPAKKLVVTVNEDTPNVATVVKNDTETFKVTLDKDADGCYSVVAVSDQNRYAAVEKKDGNFVVTISDNYFDTYAPVVTYTK